MSGAVNNSNNTTAHEAWVESIEQRCNAKIAEWPSHIEPCTIHRVPHRIRAVDEGAYEPTMLSIGPYHRSNPKLQAMEDHKWRYLHAILRRKPERTLGDYLKELETLEVPLRSFYSEIIKLESNDFVEMMLLDGCFIVELFLKVEGSDAAEVDDVIFSTNWVLQNVSLDMLLLENQLPFLVLENIFRLLTGLGTDELVKHALQVFKRLMPANPEITPRNSVPFQHLLHLYHWLLLPTSLREIDCSLPPCFKIRLPSFPSVGKIRLPSFPSATEIQHNGIRFEMTSTASILDVEFIRDVLKIPVIYIDHYTNTLFRNLIALEQCYPNCGAYFTNYAIFMDCLIDSPQDVGILKSKDTIKHMLGSDEEVALLFNKMCIGIPFDSEGGFLSEIMYDVTAYCESKWVSRRAQLMRDYFKEPWAIINLQFTITTIIFTVVQTVLAVLSYKRSS